MQFKLSPTKDPRHAINNRRYAYECRERDKGYPYIGAIQITPDGWILYELVYLISREGRSGEFEMEDYLLLVDGDAPKETYSLTDEEFFEFPSMRPNWFSPF